MLMLTETALLKNKYYLYKFLLIYSTYLYDHFPNIIKVYFTEEKMFTVFTCY